MTRLPDLDPERTSPDVRDILDALPDLNLFNVLGHADTVLVPWLTMGGTLLSGLSLDAQLRELVILQVAATTCCDYERIQHEAIAAGVGVPDEQIDAVVDQRLDDACLADRADLLRAVDRLIRTHSLDDAAFATLTDQLDSRQTVELLIVVGHYLGIALLAGAVALSPDDAADMAVVDAANTNLGIRP